MNPRPLLLAGALIPLLWLLGGASPASFLLASALSSGIVLQSKKDFESVAAELCAGGVNASAPARIVGKSGVKHEFALAAVEDGGKAKVVVDTELSVKEVDEMKVLKFYVKVFDVSPEKAILCVSPGLSDRGKTLAKEYGIAVIENEVPRKLVSMAADSVDAILGRSHK